uniref:Glycosyltransferase n=1 Tax=Scoparia dulcis TaxID=107240 RepID=A0A5H2Q6G2_SCODU|nr:UDP-glycosyltransferase [Scoparia dulcis]
MMLKLVWGCQIYKQPTPYFAKMKADENGSVSAVSVYLMYIHSYGGEIRTIKNKTYREQNQEEKMSERRKAHAIVFPVPYQGHINPMINLTLKLASKGITVTFVHTEFVHNTLVKAQKHNMAQEVDIFSDARASGLDIRYTTISDGYPLDFDRDLRFEEFWCGVMRDFPARVSDFVEKMIKSDPSSAYFLVADTWFHWLPSIAKKYNIASVSFWTQPALVFSMIYHLDLLKQNGHLSLKGDVEEEINYLPGVESINTRDIMAYLKIERKEIAMYENVFLIFEDAKETDFVLHNTVQELESRTLSALNESLPNYAIGPVNFFQAPSSAASKSLRSESDCNKWLDSKPPGSVLYVSFGSLVQMNKQMVEEVAYGLLQSEVNFIWVVRSSILGSESDILPVGFEDETKDRGLIVPWCNQIEVLSHPAVAGFLTHCGWNSTLESMWCGVPMICYPIYFEQPTNKKLVVEEWKIGISLSDGPAVNREEVSEKIRSIISGDTSELLKKQIKKIQSILRNAVDSDGSSEKNFDKFVEDLHVKLN